MSLRDAVVAQFRQPRGYAGRISGWVMATRGSNRVRNQWTVGLLNIQTGDRILEIGCGPGVGLKACLARSRGVKVVGLDHSQTMLDQARARNDEAIHKGHLELWLGSLDELPETVSSFDKIYSANVVQFLPDRPAAFRKIFALLRPGGVVATTYLPRSKKPEKAESLEMAEDVTRHMEAAGFANIRVEELAMEPAPAVCILGEHP